MGLVVGTAGGAPLRIGNGGGAAPADDPWPAEDDAGMGGACLCGDGGTAAATSKSYTSFCGGSGGGGSFGTGTSKPWKKKIKLNY